MALDALADRLTAAAAQVEAGNALATQVSAIRVMLGVVREDSRYALKARELLSAELAVGGHSKHLEVELKRALAELPTQPESGQ